MIYDYVTKEFALEDMMDYMKERLHLERHHVKSMKKTNKLQT